MRSYVVTLMFLCSLTSCGEAATPPLRGLSAPAVTLPAPVASVAVEPSATNTNSTRPLAAPRAMMADFTLHPAGTFLITRWEGAERFAVWRFPQLERVARFGLRTQSPEAAWLEFSNDGSRLYAVESMSSSFEAHGLELWSTASWEPIATEQAQLSSGVGAVESPDGRHLFLADVYTQVELYDLQSGKRRLRQGFPMAGAPNRSASVAISSDSRHAIVIDPLGPVEIWDLASARRRLLTTMHNAGGAARFLPGSDKFLLSDGDGSVRLWDVRGKVHRVLSGPNGTPAENSDGQLDRLRLSDDGKQVVVSRMGCDVRVLSLTGAQAEVIVQGVVKGEQDADCHPSLGPDGQALVLVRRIDAGFQVEHVDLASKRKRELSTLEASWFPRVQFLDAQHLALSSGDDGKTRYFDLATGTETTKPKATRATAPLRNVALAVEAGVLVATRLSDGERLELPLGTDDDAAPPALKKALSELMAP